MNSTNQNDSGDNVQYLDCSDIERFINQPRTYFGEEEMDDLVSGIRAIGQKKAIEVMPLLPPHKKFGLIDGERRWLACIRIGGGLKVKALIRIESLDEKHRFLESVLANAGQESLADLDKARAILKVKTDFRLNNSRTAQLIGKSSNFVESHISILNLDQEILDMMSPKLPREERLSFCKALLVKMSPPEERVRVAKMIMSNKLSVEGAREFVRSNRKRASEPYREVLKFKHFLDLTLKDSDTILAKSQGYFDDMLLPRQYREICEMTKSTNEIIENFLVIKSILERVRGVFVSKNAQKAS